jgi:MOSC domain-containing protein YiiM
MQLLSVNVGQKRNQFNGENLETTGIYKFSVDGSVEITHLGIKTDFIGSKRHHGGPDQAVYVYGGGDYAWWSNELGREVEPGTFGDNLTISELESAGFNTGDYLHVGEVTLQVTAPRIPCATFAARMGDPLWVKKFRRAERPGLYCRVIREGFVATGDSVSIEKYQGETLSILQMYREYYEKDKNEETIRRQLNAPIAIRDRVSLEKKLEKLMSKKGEISCLLN